MTEARGHGDQAELDPSTTTPMRLLRSRFSAAMRQAFEADDSPDPMVRTSSHSDYQVNGAIPLSKLTHRTAEEMAAKVAKAVQLDGIADAVTVTAKGFINVDLNDSYINRALGRMVADEERFYFPLTDDPLVVVVDYSHPNVAKEMHVGHLRTTIIGDALVRILEFQGHRVVRENHIGDWGTPFGMLIEHLIDVGEANGAESLSVGDLSAFYQSARAKFDADPGFAERARHRVVLLQGGDSETLDLWGLLVAASERYFEHVYKLLGVRLKPEDIAGESQYNPMLSGLLEEFRQKGLLVESEGAQCVFPDGFQTRAGEPLPLIVQKADGGFGYAATDLATIKDRLDRLNADVILYVVGSPQRDHLAMCFAVATMAGWIKGPHTVRHVAFGNVLGEDRKPFRTRAGGNVKLIDLLEEAVRRATVLVGEKSPRLDQTEREAVGRAVGIGAVKYADLSVDRQKDYVFDWERMLSFDGNTGPYIQYAYARSLSILRAADSGSWLIPGITGQAAEHALALSLLYFSDAVSDSLEKYAPHRLCSYLYGLSVAFTRFYEECPVLKSPSEVRNARLGMVYAFSIVTRKGLSLLGIASPEVI